MVPILAAAGAFARRLVVNALVNKAKDKLGGMFKAEASSGWSALSYGVFGVSFLGFILVLAVAGGAAGEHAGLTNPREPQPGPASGRGCGSLDDPTTASAAGADAFFKSRNSPLEGTGESLIAAAQEFGVSPAFMIGIANAESSLGKNGRAVPNKNPGNIKTSEKTLLEAGFKKGPDGDFIGHDDQNHVIFTNWASGWRGLAEVLRRNYFDNERKTLENIAEKYLEGNKPNWIKNVTKVMEEACEKEVPEGLPGEPPLACAQLAGAANLTIVNSNDREGLSKGWIKRVRGDERGGPGDQAGALVKVDVSLCESLQLLLGAGMNITVTSILGEHPHWSDAEGRRESFHWIGQAMDIADGGGNETFVRLLFEKRAELGINEIITGKYPQYNVDNGRPFMFSDTERGRHMTHIHVSFGTKP